MPDAPCIARLTINVDVPKLVAQWTDRARMARMSALPSIADALEQCARELQEECEDEDQKRQGQ